MAVSKVILNGETLIDVTQKTVTSENMLSGVTALKNDGTDITGSIAAKSAADLITSGSQVTVPSGMYAAAVSTAVAAGVAGTPTASKGTISNHSVSITPSVTNTTGYITGGTETGTAVTVSANELVSGTKTVTSSGNVDVTNYATAYVSAGSVAVPGAMVSSGPKITVSNTGLITTTASASISVSPTITSGWVTSGTSGIINFAGTSSLQLSTQAAATVAPTENEQTAVASGKYTTGIVKVAAIPSDYIGSAIASVSVVEGTTTVSGTTATRGTATWSAGVISSGSIQAATFANSSSAQTQYVDISATTEAPVLVSGGYLYINKGYTDDLKISLAKLVPDGASADLASDKILSGYAAYDNDGNLVAGNIPTKTSANISVAGPTVSIPSGYYATDVSKAVASGSINLNLYSQIDLDSDSFNINSNTGVVYVNGGVISTGRPGFSSGYISDPGYYMIEASASGSYALPTWEGATFIPSEESMMVTPSNVYTLSDTIIAAIPSSYVGSAVARRSAADLTAAGSVVSAPSGYYEAGVSKAVASGTLNEYISLPSINPTWSLNSSTGIINAQYQVAPGIQPIASSGYFETGEYIYPMITMDSSYQLPVKTASDLTASGSVVTVPSGYYTTNVSKAIASGSITAGINYTPAIGAFTLNSSTGVITVTRSSYYDDLTIQVTSSGFIENNVTIPSGLKLNGNSKTYALPTKAAATIIPSTADQVVASGYFLTGAQTIKGDSALIPSNIAAGVSIFGIEGTHQGGGNYQTKIAYPSTDVQIIWPDALSTPMAISSAGSIAERGENNLFYALSSFISITAGETWHVNGALSFSNGGSIYFNTDYVGGTSCFNFTSIGSPSVDYFTFNTTYAELQVHFVGGAPESGVVISDVEFYKPTYEAYDALSSVTVEAAALQSKVVTPSTEQQIIIPDSSLYGIIPAGATSTNISGWLAIGNVLPPSPISVGTYVKGTLKYVYNDTLIGTIIIDGNITSTDFKSICTVIPEPSYSGLSVQGTTWDSDGLNFYLSLGGGTLVAAADIRFDSLPVYNYYGLSQVTVEAVAATTSYYLAQDSQGYITYSSIMPSSGEYYIFDVAGIKHVEGN